MTFFAQTNVPLKISVIENMTDDEFFSFCQKNPDLRIERDEHFQIYIMAPTATITGLRNSDLNGELVIWNKKYKLGYVFDSNTAFTLPDNSVLSPDVSWMAKEKWDILPDEEKNKFAHVCPDFVIELKSRTDDMDRQKLKMQKWITNGCKLAWLICPDTEEVSIFRSRSSASRVEGFNNKISGEDILPGFELDLSILK